MNINEFKAQAKLETLEFYKSAKGTEYCPTDIGTVFKAKDYNPKSKVKTVLPGFDNQGRKVWNLSNKVSTSKE